ncbi:MAG: electron transport complex subunit E [Deltaproteobacteria bacterium]|nr:electron transport complex subunit E [Deltaproteobacteria bacterium]
MSFVTELKRGIWTDNAVFKLGLGLCPALAVTSSALNGVGMGLAATFVLICSNVAVSSMRKIIPSKVRIPAFIVLIATFVTVVDLVMAGFLPGLHKALGIFIPLIVVNCVILGRAEAFASKNPIFHSAIDGVVMGLGFTVALLVLGSVREILGNGTIFGAGILGSSYIPALLLILPPGAFLAIGFLLGGMNKLEASKK